MGTSTGAGMAKLVEYGIAALGTRHYICSYWRNKLTASLDVDVWGCSISTLLTATVVQSGVLEFSLWTFPAKQHSSW